MTRFRPGTRVQYSNGVIYRVLPDGSYRREDGGKTGKVKKKAAKKARSRRLKKHQVHRLEACATGGQE